MTKKTCKNTDNQQNLSEPVANYQTKNRIKIYHSFEEEAEDNYKYLASLSPEQHLANTKKLIDRIYKNNPDEASDENKRINFD